MLIMTCISNDKNVAVIVAIVVIIIWPSLYTQ